MRRTLQRVIFFALLIAVVYAGLWPWEKDEKKPKRTAKKAQDNMVDEAETEGPDYNPSAVEANLGVETLPN